MWDPMLITQACFSPSDSNTKRHCKQEQQIKYNREEGQTGDLKGRSWRPPACTFQIFEGSTNLCSSTWIAFESHSCLKGRVGSFHEGSGLGRFQWALLAIKTLTAQVQALDVRVLSMSQYIYPSDAHKGREMTVRRVSGSITCTVKGTSAGLDVLSGLHAPPTPAGSLGNFDGMTSPLASMKVQTLIH